MKIPSRRHRVDADVAPSAARQLATVTLAFTLASAPAVHGNGDVPALLEKSRCNACHTERQTLIGPPYRAIAARHAGRDDLMVEVLARKIVLGGGGNWGVVPMVPNEHVSLEDARRMAHWILRLDAGGG